GDAQVRRRHDLIRRRGEGQLAERDEIERERAVALADRGLRARGWRLADGADLGAGDRLLLGDDLAVNARGRFEPQNDLGVGTDVELDLDLRARPQAVAERTDHVRARQQAGDVGFALA